jgi:glutamate dehydrogenase
MAKTRADSRARLISRICAQARAKVPADRQDLVEEFTRQYYRNVSTSDMHDMRISDLVGSALSQLELAQTRAENTPSLRVLNPSTRKHGWRSKHTVVQVVTNDMPFLVDSLGMVMNRNGLSVQLTIHPVMNVHRDADGELLDVLPRNEASDDAIAEAMMHIELDRETVPANLQRIEADLISALSDVRAAVEDWNAIRGKALAACEALATAPEGVPAREVTETRAFLEWMESGHFTFLGYREYQLSRSGSKDTLRAVADSGLGILRDPGTRARAGSVLPKDVAKRAREKDLLIVTKANSQSTVHRPALLDYVGVKIFDDAGQVIGERRFLGLFTSVAYNRSPRDIPLLRHKVQQVMSMSGLHPSGHAGKALMHILETFPRDELFQSTVSELVEITVGILHLQERQQVKAFIRRDTFGRFFSCLIYVPRERYHTGIRHRIQDILMRALNGRSVESEVQLSESVLARVRIIVHTTPWKSVRFKIEDIEAEITEVVRTWTDHLRDELIERHGEEHGIKLLHRYGEAFPAAYSDEIPSRAAAFDIDKMEELDLDTDALAMSLYRPAGYPDANLRFKLFHPEQPISISDALPMLEHMGLKVISEQPYQIEMRDASMIWIQDFEMLHTVPGTLDPVVVRGRFQDCFEAVYRGQCENDDFNQLVIHAGLDWRQAMVLRAYCKYMQQVGCRFSQSYMQQAITRNSGIARLLIELFCARLDPKLSDKERERDALTAAQAIDDALDKVSSQDEDRILRIFLDLIRATLRTNYYQRDTQGRPKEYVSFKFDPSAVPELPLPMPTFEIWVYSPRVEAVHLRGGEVARGGLRWSDRREDFRTEVLGLMKAQQVKNAVIVPVGSKGGFFVKRPPVGAGREKLMAEVQHCYKSFIRGMLDITDNLDGDDLRSPTDVVCHDHGDPYLVVAADKGTATFSDLANSVAAEYNFWLGDAFASGGSVGYDHKKMGITAKGAWESVKRHFREFGIDTQSEPFTVLGIGDMSGDVFGNGMLLSRFIKLRVAFNHMHIFLDPDPDPEASFAERERLFELPRSTWEDYDPDLISKGGGVFPRSAKSIRLSAEVKRMLDVDTNTLTPQELIRAALKMKVDLIWNGGIGTYIKAADETHTEVGDRANDALRIDADEVNARVIGEGGNLGVTQRARIDIALGGGRINSDFIDNAGGVDCSDHEVNIKILLNLVRKSRRFSERQRNVLLATMTDEVSSLVLRNNYVQTQAISVMESQSVDRLSEFAHLITVLERRGGLNRALEFLPTSDEIEERAKSGHGLTRPEVSVIQSYAKINLFEILLASDMVEDPYFRQTLVDYFPAPLPKRYQELMGQHRLRKEIIATVVTNDLINRMGPTFAYRMHEETGAGGAAIARAYSMAVGAFRLRDLWSEIEALDNNAPASVQYSMMVQISRLLKHATRWVLSRRNRYPEIAQAVEHLGPGIGALIDNLHGLLQGDDLSHFDSACAQYTELGVPLSVARRVAGLNFLYAAMDIVEVAAQSGTDVSFVAGVYFHLGSGLELDWSRDQIERLKVSGHWQAVARGTLRENLYALQRELAAQVITGRNGGDDAQEVVEAWLEARSDEVDHSRQLLTDMGSGGDLDFATLSVALQEIRKLASVEPPV